MNTPPAIRDNQVAAAKTKTTLPFAKMVELGAIAGACIALGACTSSMAAHGVANYGLARLVAGAVFPVGLILIVLVGAELFTGNCLMSIALADGKVRPLPVVRNLAVVWCANFAGAAAVALLAWKSGQWGASGFALGAYTVRVAAAKAALTPLQAFCSGILCNILVCLAILAAGSSKRASGKAIATWFPIMAFVLGGFEHSVANMYYLPAGLMALADCSCAAKVAAAGMDASALTIAGAARNLFFVTLGNVVGGMVFVGLVWGAAHRKQ
ncbi:MAG: formate/nitrite transporter family protein [Kiritimatiellae bacterium]|nr:formate/nitrite transporter family protein [Kiritimatiellia bacterium]